jgi:hypothetical protein
MAVQRPYLVYIVNVLQSLNISCNPLSASTPGSPITFWEIWYNHTKPAATSAMHGTPPHWVESEVVLHQAQLRLMAALLPGLPEDERQLITDRQKSSAARGLKRHLQSAAAVADASFLGECLQTAEEVRICFAMCCVLTDAS